MLIPRPRRFPLTASAKTSTPESFGSGAFWFSLSLVFATFYGVQSLQLAFSGEYVVQDDARQYVFWMQRFLDAELFPKDWIAEYYQSISPPGYIALFRLMASWGLDPLLFSKWLPPILGLITTGYCFGVCLQLLPVPAAGFITTLLLNQGLWMEDDLISATPRSFLYPLLFAFLYYLLRRSWLPCMVAIVLQGLFYPQIVLLSAALLTLRLWRWSGKGPRLSKFSADYWFWGTGLAMAALVLLPFALSTSEFGPAITAAQARLQPEFNYVNGRYGRTFFFHENPLVFWFLAPRSGLLFTGLLPPLVLVGLALPWWLRRPARFPLARRVSKEICLFQQMLLASLGLFFLAHALLFKLYLPNRYMAHSLRVLLTLAAGIALTLWLDAQLRAWAKHWQTGFTGRQWLTAGLTVSLAAGLILIPLAPSITLPSQLQVKGKVPPLYEFLLRQPKDTLIASLTKEADNLPTFAQRSILLGWEYALPYHPGYYAEIRQRALDLITAQYSADPAQVQRFVQSYGVDFFLLDRAAFDLDYVADSLWIQQFQPAAAEAVANLQQGAAPVLAKALERCSVLETQHLVLLQANCVTQAEVSEQTSPGLL